MATEILKKRFTTGDFHLMAEAGILAEHDRVELIDGEIIEMSPIGHRHRVRVARLHTLFVRAFGDLAVVICQASIELNEWSESEPDLVVLKPRADFYAGKPWAPGDVFFVMEVADSSLRYDRKIKVPLYARAGIPEYWIEDAKRDVLHVYRDPAGETYATSLELRRTDVIAPLALPDIQFSIDHLFGDPILSC
jgi:Uma2 family endonuclease